MSCMIIPDQRIGIADMTLSCTGVESDHLISADETRKGYDGCNMSADRLVIAVCTEKCRFFSLLMGSFPVLDQRSSTKMTGLFFRPSFYAEVLIRFDGCSNLFCMFSVIFCSYPPGFMALI